MLFEYYPEEILSYVLYVLLNFSNPTFLLAAITFILIKSYKLEGLPVAQMVKNLPAMKGMQQETQFQSLGREDPLEEGMATHSNILSWRIPWTEGPGGLQSMESQRAGHDGVSDTFKLDAWKWGVSFLLL